MRLAALLLVLLFALPAVVAQPAAPERYSPERYSPERYSPERYSPERYSEVRIPLADRADLQALAAQVPGLGHVGIDKAAGGLVAVTVLNQDDLADLAASRFAFEVSVPDLAAAYDARPAFTEAEQRQALAASKVDGFGFGSMGGYYTFDEVVAKLDEMAASYPNLITEKVSIGQSHQGRDIWMVKISDNPGVDEGEPEVAYTALHHAREPQSMATVVYYMFYLLENYGTNAMVTNLVNNREMYFVPVLNPDGYVYNQQTDPNGGGLWRKNRRNNGNNRFGVDLNRNYGYEWGRDNDGSSPSPGSETYRGPAPFSEPETSAIRDFTVGREIRATFNYHSFSNVLLHPWGYARNTYTPEQGLFTRASRFLTGVNGYEFGQAADVLYPANGASDDWQYGEQTTKDRVFSWTPEVGSFRQGFWPRQSDIVPLAEINRVMNLRLAQIAGFYPTVTAFAVAETHTRNGSLDPGEAAAATITVTNVGLEARTGLRVRVVGTDPAMGVEASAWSAPFDLEPGESREVAGLAFTLGADAPLGVEGGLGVEFAFGNETLTEAVEDVAISTPVASESGVQPGAAQLFESYPNPFAEQTLVPFSLAEAGPVEVAVYDLLGQRVRVLADETRSAGQHTVSWNGRDGAGQPVASGVYVCTLRAGGVVATRKLLVVR